VLGVRTRATRDVVVLNVVQTTPGVSALDAYNSAVNVDTRTWSAAMTLDTVYGAIPLVAPALPATIPPLPPLPAGPSGAALLLGLRGGPSPQTDTLMEPANLTQPGQQNITDFQVRQVDAGRF
jgi:hypothetical protein